MAFIQNVELSWTDWKTFVAALSGPTVYYLKNDLQFVPFVIDDTSNFVYYTNINRDPGSTSGPYAALSSGVKATATIQDITYTANAYGTAGNSITIQYTNTASAIGQEFVTVSGNAIVVHIVSGSSTAQQVLTAAVAWSAYNGGINHAQAAAALVSAIVSGSTGHPQTTQGPTSLASGANAVTVISDWTTNFQSSAVVVGSFMDGYAEEVAS